MKIKIGTRMMLYPHDLEPCVKSRYPCKKLPCTVIYIHPKKRFFRVEFEFSGGGKIREAYKLPLLSDERTKE